MTYTATYSPEDNKLRLYASSRLDKETYERVKRAGFRWAPKQDLFYATWCPIAEDIARELAGEIDDEDKSLVDRAEERAERFEGYSDSRTEDAEQARKAVHAIADNIPFGQPILVGHHSEKHARKDAERIENGMRKAVRMWETASYWKDRAKGAIAHAKYKELPSVRARRIKTIEADKRREERRRDDATDFLRLWAKDGLTYDRAKAITNTGCHISRCFTLEKYPRQAPASQYEGPMSLWSALDGGVITAEQARAIAIPSHESSKRNAERWIQHLENRLTYERAMLQESGGTETDKHGPEVGGGVRCWASPGRFDRDKGFSYVHKVNKVSVTVLDNWGNQGPNFTRTIPFDKCTAVVSRAFVEEARQSGRLVETPDKTGFYIVATSTPAPKTQELEPPKPELKNDGEQFELMRESLRAGVKTVSANQLFPTPADLALRMVWAAGLHKYPALRILEPSAGTGAILDALKPWDNAEVVAVEINRTLVENLAKRSGVAVCCGDFLEYAPGGGDLGQFDRIIMNPPFQNGDDIKHIRQAMTMLKPGGRLVAICANGPRQQAALKPLAEGSGGIWEELPEGTFAGTGVRTVLATFNEGEEASR